MTEPQPFRHLLPLYAVIFLGFAGFALICRHWRFSCWLSENKNLSLDRMSKLIHTEMKTKLSAGDKKMAKRGGKEAPSAESIACHALQNLE